MNFNFGTPKTTGGFTFATPTPAPAANANLGFASGDNKGLQASKAPTFGLFTPSTTTSFSLGSQTTVAPTLSFGGNTPTQNVSFGVPAASTSANTNTSALTGFNLGSSLAQPSAPTLASAGLSLSTTPSLSLGAPATAASSFTLGNTTTTSSATGFSLGGISSTGLTLGTPSTTTSAGGFQLGKVVPTPVTTSTSITLTLPTSTAASTTQTTAVSSTATVPTTTTGGLTFVQIEEALNKWTLELEDQGKMFINQAVQLNAWDRLVIANGEKILTLNSGIEKVKQQQEQLDHELDFVLAQQRELEECIIPLEKELQDFPVADHDRNHTYQLAENLDTQLKQMSEDLKEIIEHLNESNKTDDSNDPVAQIGRILNAHMNSLQWIDRNTAQISAFLDQITKMHDMHRRDNERSFHLTYE